MKKVEQILGLLNKYDKYLQYELKEQTDKNIALYEHWIECTYEIEKKLKELEYLQKHGKLLELPCTVGDTVYTNCTMKGWYFRGKNKPYAAKIVFIGINGKENYMNIVFENEGMLQFQFSDLGKLFFLTKEEAIIALGKN